jgi:hypothetical protein
VSSMLDTAHTQHTNLQTTIDLVEIPQRRQCRACSARDCSTDTGRIANVDVTTHTVMHLTVVDSIEGTSLFLLQISQQSHST